MEVDEAAAAAAAKRPRWSAKEQRALEAGVAACGRDWAAVKSWDAKRANVLANRSTGSLSAKHWQTHSNKNAASSASAPAAPAAAAALEARETHATPPQQPPLPPASPAPAPARGPAPLVASLIDVSPAPAPACASDLFSTAFGDIDNVNGEFVWAMWSGREWPAFVTTDATLRQRLASERKAGDTLLVRVLPDLAALWCKLDEVRKFDPCEATARSTKRRKVTFYSSSQSGEAMRLSKALREALTYARKLTLCVVCGESMESTPRSPFIHCGLWGVECIHGGHAACLGVDKETPTKLCGDWYCGMPCPLGASARGTGGAAVEVEAVDEDEAEHARLVQQLADERAARARARVRQEAELNAVRARAQATLTAVEAECSNRIRELQAALFLARAACGE